MEEEPEDLSSLHYQILFSPREPSHQQREYELERHLALMDEPARAPIQKAMDMGDLENLTIEHLTSYDEEETEEIFLLMDQDEKCQDDMLDIGIEANDLGSLLQQFEQTEAAAMTESIEHRDTSQSKKSSEDARSLAKKITPVKRKSTILLEPLAMPTKRLRAKETNLLSTERECISLPGSRASSPVTIQHQGLSVICSADQGFDYLVMDHDYCSLSGQNLNPINSASSTSSLLNDSSRPSIEERKAVYKQKYKIRKKEKKPSVVSGGRCSETAKEVAPDPVNLINKLPDYIHPMPEVPVPVKINQTGKQPKAKDNEEIANDPVEEEKIQGKYNKPEFFDKIPDYFLEKHMYQEISKVEEEEAQNKEEEARIKEEEEMTKLKEKEEMEKVQQIKDTSKNDSHLHRSRHHGRDRKRHYRNSKTSLCEEEKDLKKDKNVTTETLESTAGNSGLIADDKPCNEYAQSPEEFKGMSNSQSHGENKRSIDSDRYSRCHSLSSQSSCSRSRSLTRNRSCSASSSCSSYSRKRYRRDSKMSYTSLSSNSRSRSRSHSRSRSRSRSHSLRRHRRRRYSTYSSASRSSSSRSHSRSHSRSCSRSHSRSRSRSHSRSRSGSHSRSSHWRPRSCSRSSSRSHSRSHSRPKRRSRSGSYYSRKRSCESDRRGRSSGHRASRRQRHSQSQSRKRMRSVSVERIQKEREERLKEQQEQWSDRRVIYIGRIPYGTTRITLRKRFEKFGEIERITLHFRDVGDNYAFVTFVYKCDAYAAVAGANKDYNEPEYDICFGGRRHFCRNSYEDLDSMGQEEIALDNGYQQEPADKRSENKMETDFDRLLREAMKKNKR